MSWYWWMLILIGGVSVLSAIGVAVWFMFMDRVKASADWRQVPGMVQQGQHVAELKKGNGKDKDGKVKA